MGRYLDENELEQYKGMYPDENESHDQGPLDAGQMDAQRSMAAADQAEMQKKAYRYNKNGLSMNDEGDFHVRGDNKYTYRYDGKNFYANGNKINTDLVRRSNPHWEGFSLMKGNEKQRPPNGAPNTDSQHQIDRHLSAMEQLRAYSDEVRMNPQPGTVGMPSETRRQIGSAGVNLPYPGNVGLNANSSHPQSMRTDLARNLPEQSVSRQLALPALGAGLMAAGVGGAMGMPVAQAVMAGGGGNSGLNERAVDTWNNVQNGNLPYSQWARSSMDAADQAKMWQILNTAER